MQGLHVILIMYANGCTQRTNKPACTFTVIACTMTTPGKVITETLGPQVDHMVDCVLFGSCYGFGAHERGVTLLLLEEPDHPLVTVILSSPPKSGKWLCLAKKWKTTPLSGLH